MDYKKFIENRKNASPFGNLVGLEIKEVNEGYAYMELKVTDKLLNPIGTVHGGCLFTLADTTGGTAAASHGCYVTTVDANIHYMRPGTPGSTLCCEARELRAGEHLMVYDVTIKNNKGLLLAEGIFTYMSLGKEVVI